MNESRMCEHRVRVVCIVPCFGHCMAPFGWLQQHWFHPPNIAHHPLMSRTLSALWLWRGSCDLSSWWCWLCPSCESANCQSHGWPTLVCMFGVQCHSDVNSKQHSHFHLMMVVERLQVLRIFLVLVDSISIEVEIGIGCVRSSINRSS